MGNYELIAGTVISLKYVNIINTAYWILLASHLASHYLLPSGLVVFTGAFAGFKDPSPSMIQYHTGKVATHNIALNLGAY